MLDRHGEKAIYLQLADRIRAQIKSGEIKAGDKLPSESEMQKEYGVARLTVREALSVLVNDGLLEKMHGKGTFCKSNPKNASIDVLLNMNDYYFIPYYVQSIAGVLDKYNYNFIVGDTKDSYKESIKLLDKIAKRGSGGVIIQASPEKEYSEEEISSSFEKLKEAGIPYVQIDAAYDTENSYAIMDEEKIGEIAASYLIENGHESIALVTLPHNRISDMRMKYARKSFRDIIEIQFDGNLTESIRHAYERGITAIFCFNDQIAKECLDSMQSLNLSIPEDVSLISVDDTIVSNLFGITSIAHAKEKIGEIAARALVRGELPFKKVFEPTLTKRSSVKKIK